MESLATGLLAPLADDAAARVGEYLTEAGFEDGGDEPAMAAVLSDLSDPSSLADFEIARVAASARP
jgi:hypothetical protein